MTYRQWIKTAAIVLLGDVLYIETKASRRKAIVRGTVPGLALVEWTA